MGGAGSFRIDELTLVIATPGESTNTPAALLLVLLLVLQSLKTVRPSLFPGLLFSTANHSHWSLAVSTTNRNGQATQTTHNSWRHYRKL
jgi:hypothetical protein